MRPQVTEEQLKSLKLFSVYLQSYGAETASKDYSIDYCSLDWTEDGFDSPQTSINIETYQRIDETLYEIIEANNLFENSVTDCDNRGVLTIEIDCVNRTLTANAMEWSVSTEDSSETKTLEEISEEYDEDTYNEVLRMFEQIGENGNAVIQFQGGGDDGEIDDFIYINGSSVDTPKLINDMVYQWLTDTGIDWYNNEGGQGSFTFVPKDGEIVLEVGQNYEENVDVPLDFKIEF